MHAIKKKQDKLDFAEIEAIRSQPILIAGEPYLFVMTYGWAIVGFFVDRPEPLIIRVAHANHFRNAQKDYGRLAMEGGEDNCEWRYEGTSKLAFAQIHHIDDYYGKVPRGTKS